MSREYDFAGWATRNNVKCSDGRTILKNAFEDCDGKEVPLVWNHLHDSPSNILGKALLHNCDDGVRVEGFFNDSKEAQKAKMLIEHGDISALSIHANKLKQSGGNVYHGVIREVSLVLAGANPYAFIDEVIMHSYDHSGDMEDVIIWTEDELEIKHSDNQSEEEEKGKVTEEKNEKTLQDVIDSMNEEQKNVLYFMIGEAVREVVQNGQIDDNDEEEEEESEEEKKEMKHNVFEGETNESNVLTHSDEMSIISIAKQSNIGSLKEAINQYLDDGETLSHGFAEPSQLFPEYKTVPNDGAPYTITRDYSWVDSVINGASKSPFARIKTRQADAKAKELRAYGYQKGKKKKEIGNITLLKRTTDPQTIYVKDKLDRDDILDITDFDYVSYQYGIMKDLLKEQIALATMIGDGREVGAEDKIQEDKIRPILTDDEVYTIHKDVDFAGIKAELQGTDTSKHFGENFIYSEAMVAAILDAKIEYKAPGEMSMYCTPKFLNKMLLARDLNGRRIYTSKADLVTALGVKEICTVEQFEGVTRTDTDNKKHDLVAILVNMNNYRYGSVKGGELTNFEQFDIDFNQYKYLMETRMSGALVEPKSAIVLETLQTTTPSESEDDENTES